MAAVPARIPYSKRSEKIEGCRDAPKGRPAVLKENDAKIRGKEPQDTAERRDSVL
jgi:hypothetical protein